MNCFGVLNNAIVNSRFQERLKEINIDETYEKVWEDLKSLSDLSRQEGLIPMCKIKCKNSVLQEFLNFVESALGDTDVSVIYEKLLFVFAPILLNDSLSSLDYILTVLYIEGMFQILSGDPTEQIQLRTKKIMGV